MFGVLKQEFRLGMRWPGSPGGGRPATASAVAVHGILIPRKAKGAAPRQRHPTCTAVSAVRHLQKKAGGQ